MKEQWNNLMMRRVTTTWGILLMSCSLRKVEIHWSTIFKIVVLQLKQRQTSMTLVRTGQERVGLAEATLNVVPGLSCRQPHSELPTSVTNLDIVVFTRISCYSITRVTIRRNRQTRDEFGTSPAETYDLDGIFSVIILISKPKNAQTKSQLVRTPLPRTSTSLSLQEKSLPARQRGRSG